MDHQILHPGNNSMLVINLNAGEQIKAESGAMVAKTDGVKIEGKLDGGIFRAVKRSVLGGEKFFFQTMHAIEKNGNVMVAPGIPGDIKVLDMTQGQDYFLQGGAFLAALGDINIDTRMQSLSRGIFSGEGLFVLHVTGKGAVAVSAFGGIHEIAIPAGEDYIVDNGHIVAWSGDCNYKIEKASAGWISTFTSGEGFVCRFTGPGKVWIQTRNPQSFGAWIRRFIPVRG